MNFYGTKQEAFAEMLRRGFRFAYEVYENDRSYWVRTDGLKDIFMDHSATVTRVGRNEYSISDFVEKRKQVKGKT